MARIGAGGCCPGQWRHRSILQVDYDNSVIAQSRRYRTDQSSGNATQASPYERARGAGRDALRATVIEAAGELIATDGAAGLTMRRLAAALGCTTTVLYTMFASKQGLIDAMYREGFDRLRARMRAIPAGAPPAERLRMSALAYRENALSSPQLYQLTFGAAAHTHTPGSEATAAAEASLEPLIEIVQACIDADLFRPEEPRFIAQVLTAAAHGAVSLELSHYFWSHVEAEQRYSTLTAAAARAFTR
jgi:AcrR family transcriptional regulator